MKDIFIKSFKEDKKSIRAICAEQNVCLKDVLIVLNEAGLVKLHDGNRAKELFESLQGLGEFNYIIEKAGCIFEIKSIFPKSSESHGYYNLAHESPLSGHLSLQSIKNIAVVDEIFFGKRSCNWWLLDETFEPIFKIYVARDENKEHFKNQLELFENWK